MIYLHRAYLNTTKEVDILDVTHDVKRAFRESQIINGLVTIFVPGTTASLAVLENDPLIREELKKLIFSFVVVDEKKQRPLRKSGTGSLEAHLRTAFLSTSVSIPVVDNKLLLGPWQEVIAFDFDDKIGRREILIQIMGEKEEKAKK